MKSQPLIVVSPETPVIEVQQLMQEHHLRHMPVVADDASDHLVGLVTREMMLRAIPWSAESLSVLETQYILSKIKAAKVMERDVTTASEDMTVEEAARIMVDQGISCLPVLREGNLVGIITDSDLLSTTVQMMGVRNPGLRLTVTVPNQVGEMARLSAAIAGIGGNLTAFGSWPVGHNAERLGVVLKVDRVTKEQLVDAIEELSGIELLDIRAS